MPVTPLGTHTQRTGYWTTLTMTTRSGVQYDADDSTVPTGFDVQIIRYEY